MSQFVNLKKRGFTLPPGCKDLIDVLAPTRKKGKAGSVSEMFAPQKERFPSSGLAQVERFVGLLLHPRGEAFVIQITAEALRNPITLYYIKAEKAAGIVLVTSDVPQEEAVRAFFYSRAKEPLPESTQGGSATLLYPLPCEIPAASALVRGLIQEVFALGSDAGLDFEYYDIEKTG
jgi:hypothetical protein